MRSSEQRRKSALLIEEFQQQQQFLGEKNPVKNIAAALPTKTAVVGTIPQAATSRRGICGNYINRQKSTAVVPGSGTIVGIVNKNVGIEGKEKRVISKFDVVNANCSANVVVNASLPAVIAPLLKSASAM